MEITQKIYKCLADHPEGCTPSRIARLTRLNVSSVKSALSRMTGIEKPMRGIYKVSTGGDGTIPSTSDLTDWNFHNCVLSGESEIVDFNEPVIYEWGLVKVFLDVNNFKAVCRVSTDYPLNVSSLCFVAGFFKQKCLIPGDVMVSTIEFNRDFANLRLDGVKAISIGGLVEQFKAYQKKRGLRLEHKTKLPFSVNNIVDLLSQNPMSADLHKKLADQSEHINRLSQQLHINNQVLQELVKK